MTPCAAFEDRLLEYDELSAADRRDVDAHVAGCGACHEYLELLREVDAALTAEVRGIRIDPRRYDAVKKQAMSAAPLTRVTRLPEWMDFVAAGAVCAFASAVAWQTGLLAYVLMALFSY